MLIVVTGKPGSGKTTLVETVISRVGGEGFTTREVRERGRRVGFKIVTSWGEEMWLARVGHRSPARVGRYGVFLENVERLAEKMLKILESDELLYLDEIGKMEMKSKSFEDLVWKVLERSFPTLVTIPIVDFHPVVGEIRRRADLVIDAFEYWDRKEDATEMILRMLK